MNQASGKKSAYLFLFCLSYAILANTFSFAQLNSNNLTQYTELDGVPGSQAKSVLVDKFGYIWVGTINGLARFDGYEFKRYINDPNDSTTIKGLIVWGLFEDSKGQIWVSASPENLNVYNPATKSFRQYPFRHLIEHASYLEIGIVEFGEDNTGRMYFGVQANHGDEIATGLLYLDNDTDSIKQFETPDMQPIKNVYRITKDNAGSIWLLSYSGIFKIDENRKLIHFKAIEETIKGNDDFPADIKFKKDGHAWIYTTRANLYDFNLDQSSYNVYTPDKLTDKLYFNNTFALDSSENIWLATSRGLSRFDDREKKFEYMNAGSNQRLDQSPIQTLTFDTFGSLWISTDMEGLFKYENRAVFNSYSFNKDNPKGSVIPGWVNNIIETRDKKIWVTCSGSGEGVGISSIDLEANTVVSIPFQSILPGCLNISGIMETAPGELLLSTNLGWYTFFVKTHMLRKKELPWGKDDLWINQFYNDSRGNQWLCTYNGLYKKMPGGEDLKIYDLTNVVGGALGSNFVTRVYESPKYGLWLVTNDGLFLYNYEKDSLERLGYDKAEGDIFASQDVNSFYEQPDGTVWVGTWQGGLSRYNVETKKITTFTLAEGLPSMSIQSILGDEKNHVLWLSTFDGLSRFDIPTGQCNNYSITDGIQGQLFADGSFLKTSDGYFIFGGSNGITLFHPDEINHKSAPPKVFLTDFKIYNKSVVPSENSILKKPIYETEEIILEYDQNNISIEFQIIHYSNPAKNKYAYKLENYDNEWRLGSAKQDAFYSRLSPGKYEFRVKAANNIGVWNEEGVTLKITIMPPWWKTYWAYTAYVLILGGGVFLADRFLRYRLIQKERNRSRDRELAQAKEIEKAYYKLEESHETLKATQSQLIQSEKMASLGELTAGIAHEIQNPLNFVNNFSEVSNELLDEMKDELANNNQEEVVAIANDVKENLQKILHHGKRAEGIVKGMLQHSRTSSGMKEPTDINVLVDEYLRLSFHGLRAKDKSFNAEFKAMLDESLPKISVIPQDIGRVLLNLINNAFYAVDQKAKRVTDGYRPEVVISTKKLVNQIEIRVRDNADGIPATILDKIFHPFFTTKPTGQGTGLGLSISYDIITKGHDGQLKVETKEGSGTEFIIIIPT